MNVSNEEIERTLNEKYHSHLVMADKKDKLWELCQSFIIKHHITGVEAIFDGNLDNGDHFGLLESMADIVGYFTFQEDETTNGK